MIPSVTPKALPKPFYETLSDLIQGPFKVLSVKALANTDRFIDTQSITIVVVSDLHTGSIYALMPKEWKLMGSHHAVNPSDHQLLLLEAWTTVVERWRSPDILVVLGDAVDGQQPSDKGVTVWTPSTYDQVLACKTLLQMFGAKHTFIVQGTRYHVTGSGLAVEELLAREMNSDFYSEEHRKLGIRSDKELWLKVNDIVFHFTHPISSKGPNILKRELAEAIDHGADVAVRGHYHAYRHWETSTGHIFISPCWQLRTSYMAEKSPLGLLPDIGALRFTVEGNDFGYEKLLFPTTKPQPTEVLEL